MKEYPLVSVVIPTHNRKEKLVRLIDSILQSSYPSDRLEIIVVDDASTDGTCEILRKRYKNLIKKGKMIIIRNANERLVAESRNIGVRRSTGDFIIFIDDDNIVDKNMIKYLVECMRNNPNVGICAPLMLYYNSDIIWCAGVKRNMITSKTTYILNGKDFTKIKLPKFIESADFPNCFMVRAEIIKKHNIQFDSKSFPIHYEESDFCYKIRKLGYQAICYTKAIVWHDVKRDKVTGFESEWRTFYTARNRILFHRKYSKWWQFLIFILIFNWIFALYYLTHIVFIRKGNLNSKIKIILSYLRGILVGISQSIYKQTGG